MYVMLTVSYVDYPLICYTLSIIVTENIPLCGLLNVNVCFAECLSVLKLSTVAVYFTNVTVCVVKCHCVLWCSSLRITVMFIYICGYC